MGFDLVWALFFVVSLGVAFILVLARRRCARHYTDTKQRSFNAKSIKIFGVMGLTVEKAADHNKILEGEILYLTGAAIEISGEDVKISKDKKKLIVTDGKITACDKSDTIIIKGSVLYVKMLDESTEIDPRLLRQF